MKSIEETVAVTSDIFQERKEKTRSRKAIVNQTSLIVDTGNAFRTWRMEKIVRL